MNRTELTRAVAADLRCSVLQAETLVKTVLGQIEKGLEADGKVTLTGFGTFNRRKRRARVGRNPHTGEILQIPEGTRVTFSVSKLVARRSA